MSGNINPDKILNKDELTIPRKGRELIVILSIFVTLFALITASSHFLGSKFLSGEGFSGNKAFWGSASDWFSGVAGVSIGLAGSAIAIWLAFRVEKLTVEQNKLNNTQLKIDLISSSGDVERRARLALHAYKSIQEIYEAAAQLKRNDMAFYLDLEKGGYYTSLHDTELHISKYAISEDFSRFPEETPPHQGAHQIRDGYESKNFKNKKRIFAGISNMASLLEILPEDEVEAALQRRMGNLPNIIIDHIQEHIGLDNAEEYKYEFRKAGRRLAKSLAAALPGEVSSLDVLKFLLAQAQKKVPREGNSGYPTVGYGSHRYSEEYADLIGEQAALDDLPHASMVLDALKDYLPTASFFTDYMSEISIDIVPALSAAVLDLTNPFHYTQKIIESEVRSRDLDDWVKSRLENMMLAPAYDIETSIPFLQKIFPHRKTAECFHFSAEMKTYKPDGTVHAEPVAVVDPKPEVVERIGDAGKSWTPSTRNPWVRR